MDLWENLQKRVYKSLKLRYNISMKKIPIVASLILLTNCHPVHAKSMEDDIIDSNLKVIQYNSQDEKQIECMALNIYWEARYQITKGMIAVGHVVMNRVNDKRFPSTPCEVIFQGPHRESWKTKKDANIPNERRIYYPVRNRCQFSWYCDGKSDTVPSIDLDVYNIARAISYKIYWNWYKDFTRGATHYHATYVRPAWAKSKKRTIKVGSHIFYRWK